MTIMLSQLTFSAGDHLLSTPDSNWPISLRHFVSSIYLKFTKDFVFLGLANNSGCSFEAAERTLSPSRKGYPTPFSPS
jgi:hypothetical protein